MNELGEMPNPETMQIQLISVYKSAPKREAAGGRITAGLGGHDIPSDIPTSEISDILNSAVLNGSEHITRAELPVAKLALLDELLKAAKITEPTKRFIKTEFETSYAFGIQETQDIWQILGLTDEGRKEAGIFSNDPKARMEIERQIYADQKETLLTLKAELDQSSVLEDIEEAQVFLDVLEGDFQALYGEPINPPAPTD